MSQFWIVSVLSWLSNKADDNHPRQHLSVKWETVRIIHLVIRRGDAIKHLQPVQSRLTPLGFMWKHTCSKKFKIPLTFNHLPLSWKVETDHGLLVTFKLSSQIRSLVSANWAQIRDNVLIIVWSEATELYFFEKISPLTVLQKILLGALKWYGPREGLVFILLRRKAKYFTEQKTSNLPPIFNCFTFMKSMHWKQTYL